MERERRAYHEEELEQRPRDRRVVPGKSSLSARLAPVMPVALLQEYIAAIGGTPIQRKAADREDRTHLPRPAALGPDPRPGFAQSLGIDLDAVQAKGSLEGDARQVQESASRGVSGTASPLPHLDRIQQSFGRHDIRDVRAHIGGEAAAASDALSAQAYAVGQDVAFRDSPDLHLAAHEAAHVVQQRAGVSLKGGIGEVGDVYERHADEVADKVVRGESAEALLDQMAQGGGARGPAVQRGGTHDRGADRGGRRGVRTTTGVDAPPIEVPVVTRWGQINFQAQLQARAGADAVRGTGSSDNQQNPTEVEVAGNPDDGGSVQISRLLTRDIQDAWAHDRWEVGRNSRGEWSVKVGTQGTRVTTIAGVDVYFSFNVLDFDQSREQAPLRFGTFTFSANVPLTRFPLSGFQRGAGETNVALSATISPDYVTIGREVATQLGRAGARMAGEAVVSEGAAGAASTAATTVLPFLVLSATVAGISYLAYSDMRRAREFPRVGVAAARHLYYYCISYTAGILGRNVGYSGEHGRAGTEAARRDLQTYARQHHASLESVRATARNLSAKKVYRAIFNRALPTYRDAALQEVQGREDRGRVLMEGILRRARWDGDIFRHHGRATVV